ncbi:MAG: hypothetical protein RL616_1501 [Verrucomicrobiota bacterium]|jgi:hypothetical protein
MKDIKKLENLHVSLWLLKDCAWCQDWVKVGMMVALPTIFLAAKIAWERRQDAEELVYNLAVCCWLCANVTWMIGEFFFDDGTRAIARVFFFAGLLLIGGFYIYQFVRSRRQA